MDYLVTWVFDADHEALEELLINDPVPQSTLFRSLKCGLRIVERRERKLSHVAPALTILLQFGANWNGNTLLNEQKTPYHIICQSEGDHHELLDLMMKSSQGVVIDAQDISKHTALMYAVRNTNINCIKKLIENGARLDVIDGGYCPYMWTEIARLNIIDGVYHRNMWTEIINMGNVELLKYMINHGIDKDTTDQYGYSVLWYVVNSGNAGAVRYLLDVGVAIPTLKLDVEKRQCQWCVEKTLILDDYEYQAQEKVDPCLRAICHNKLEIVKLFEEYGIQSYRSFNALRCAVRHGKAGVVSYLLNKYTYPLNIECTKYSHPSEVDEERYTILTDPYLAMLSSWLPVFHITNLLLDHGADPDKQMCGPRSINALMTAIEWRNVKVTAQYIRSGVDINFRSYDCRYGKVLPFEAAVMRGYHNVAKLFLIAGCSCGQFSLNKNREDNVDLKPELMKLMKKWKVQENKVTPLQQRCRSVILNYLSPRADMKIERLPLPRLLIKFLSISEFNAVLDLKSAGI